MSLYKTLPVLLINLPAKVRFSIVGLSYLLCLAIFASVFLRSHNGSVLAIPVAVAAWLLKPREAFISLGGAVLALLVFNSLSVGGILWPHWLLLTFLSGCLSLLIEGVIVSLLRQALEMTQVLEMAQTARLKAQQAEQDMAIALEQQRQWSYHLANSLLCPVYRSPHTAQFAKGGGERYNVKPRRSTSQTRPEQQWMLEFPWLIGRKQQ